MNFKLVLFPNKNKCLCTIRLGWFWCLLYPELKERMKSNAELYNISSMTIMTSTLSINCMFYMTWMNCMTSVEWKLWVSDKHTSREAIAFKKLVLALLDHGCYYFLFNSGILNNQIEFLLLINTMSELQFTCWLFAIQSS